jgi:hypothetical protein
MRTRWSGRFSMTDLTEHRILLSPTLGTRMRPQFAKVRALILKGRSEILQRQSHGLSLGEVTNHLCFFNQRMELLWQTAISNRTVKTNRLASKDLHQWIRIVKRKLLRKVEKRPIPEPQVSKIPRRQTTRI